MTLNVDAIQLRPRDEAECAVFGLTGPEAVRVSIANSHEAFVVRRGGEVLGVWGYTLGPICSGVCQVWMLTTPAVDAHPILLTRTASRAINHLLQSFSTILVLVDLEYPAAIHLAEWLGFEIVEAPGRLTTMVLHRKRTEH